MSVGGTSASSPVSCKGPPTFSKTNGSLFFLMTQTVAGIFALLNDYRLSLGLGPLGFVNPLLYSLGRNGSAFSGFNDIVSGSNPGCGTDGEFSVSTRY